MAERVLDRLFAQAAAAVETQQALDDPERDIQTKEKSSEEEMRKLKTTMTVSDAIRRILLADKDKDYFRMLELPPPAIDALGRPAWSVAPSDVSKAYRKLSILVHPDKNPGEEARQAFEALNQAHRLLKDPGELETILKDHLDQAKARREEAEAKATLDERVLLKAQHKEEAKQLRKQEGEALHAEVLRQMREKQERAKRRREAASKYKRARDADSSLLDEDDGDDDEEGDQGGHGDEAGSDSDVEAAQRQRQALAKRRQRQKKMAAL